MNDSIIMRFFEKNKVWTFQQKQCQQRNWKTYQIQIVFINIYDIKYKMLNWNMASLFLVLSFLKSTLLNSRHATVKTGAIHNDWLLFLSALVDMLQNLDANGV